MISKIDPYVGYCHVIDMVEQLHKDMEPKILTAVSELERDIEYARMNIRRLKVDDPSIYDALMSLVCEMQRIVSKIFIIGDLTFIRGLELLLSNWPEHSRQVDEVKGLVHRIMLLNKMIKVKQGMTQILDGGCELVREETKKYNKESLIAKLAE